MAGRTGAGVGVVVTISLLGVFTFGLFVGTIVLWGQYNETLTKLEAAEADNVDFIRPDERSIERISELVADARTERQSLVKYLVEAQTELMGAVSGFPEDSVEDFRTKAQTLAVGVGGDDAPRLSDALATSGSLFGVITDLTRDAEALAARAVAAEDARDDMRAEMDRQIAEFEDFRNAQLAATGELERQIENLQRDASDYRDGILRQEQIYAQRLENFERQASSREETLRQRIEDFEREIILLQADVSRYRQDEREAGETLQPLPEEALVDARIEGVLPAENEVFISLGRKDNVVLGMRFSVYADPTLIRPNAQGEYPEGKASIEVISIGEDSSRARILSEARGNQVVQGDVIANAAYDPDKVYKFMVIGNFPAAGATTATPGGADEVRALIEGWGGLVVDELIGDLDMLVLGERPRIPPQPPVDAPINVFDEFRRLERKAQRYDELLKHARATSIPVLNRNRLFTLIGGATARTR